MIEFIVCDDNKVIINNVVSTIEKTMMKNSNDYIIKTFEDYNVDFFDFVKKKNGYRIYILDIEMSSASGIDVARLIRNNDTNAIIIFLTAHSELGSALLGEELMFLTFINKFNDYKTKVKSAIEKALDIIGKNAILRYSDQYGVYTIPLNDILYITKDSVERKAIIKTSYAEFRAKLTLGEIYLMLNENFKYSHRSCIVNMNQILKYDFKKNKIIFIDGNTIDAVSTLFKKEMKKNILV